MEKHPSYSALLLALALAAGTSIANAQVAPSDGSTTRQAKKQELKTLENSGYRPEAQDPHYPDDVQAAEKKANSAAPASGTSPK